ncbi:hypothetical protein THASP1DRAFT_29218 [Thamnocephalis sphaerospora]|uniref:Arf-GAP domain-containing protein n=1 Tax=Thamnocephalis sphaerospora TaxID=78915 RepID=A0A4P9XU76_9FUNG|nr:hypothetical protein THASP1DRAFT_29218 [Thamnocephalis sphaerospora]|eukprot:RKP08990.1 hypothetical protein THASP1DRAFT_29218 [Thamnocephalis sphaerospora]
MTGINAAPRLYVGRILRELLKQPENRQCFDCPQRAPIYANMLNNTFVCEACSGLHRELSHRIKSISASRFTTQEVGALRNGGNSKAAEIWMAKWDEKKDRVPEISDVIRMRQYMRQKYVERRWMSDAHQHLYEPAPTARFLSTNSSEKSLGMPVGTNMMPVRRIASTQSDLSIGQLSGRSGSSLSDSANDDETAARRTRSNTGTSSSEPRRGTGMLNVVSPRAVTVYDRYQTGPRETDQRRAIGYEPVSPYDDDSSSATTSSANSTSGGRSTALTRHYLRDTNPTPDDATASPADGDHPSRRAFYREEAQRRNYCDAAGDEPIDEFFEMMRERVSGPRRYDSDPLASSSQHHRINPFAKRSGSTDLTESPRSHTPTSPGAAIREGTLISVSDSPVQSRKASGDFGGLQELNSPRAYGAASMHPAAARIARMQPQRSMSMPNVPQISVNSLDNGALALYNGQGGSYAPSPLGLASAGQQQAYAAQPGVYPLRSANAHGQSMLPIQAQTQAGASWHGPLSQPDGSMANNPFAQSFGYAPQQPQQQQQSYALQVQTTPYQQKPQQSLALYGNSASPAPIACSNNPFLFDDVRGALQDQRSSVMMASGPGVASQPNFARSQTSSFLGQQW